MYSLGPSESAAFLTSLVDAIGDAIATIDLDGHITSWNAGAERLYGIAAADAIGQRIDIVVPPDRTAEEEELRRKAVDGEIVRDCDTIGRRRSGASCEIGVTMSPIRGADGRVTGTVRIARDTSARYQSARAARRLAAIVESSDDAIASKDLNGIVKSWNRAAERMFGYSAAEMIGESIRRIIPDDRMPEEDDVLAHIRRGEKVDHFETIRRRKDGSLIPISLTVSPILDANGTVIGASKIARDISERKHADAERARLLAATQEHAEMLEKLNHVGGVVASALNRQTVIDAVTNGARAVTGATFAAFFYNAADEHHQALTLQAVSGAPRDDFADFPSAHAADVFNRLRGIPALRSDDISVDERYAHVEPFDALNSGRLGVRSYLAVPIKARSGEVVGGLFFGHPDAGRFADIHERAAIGMASWAAIALDNAQLYLGAQQANRLKDEFLATLSHELRTPLNAILGYARMVRSGIVTPEKLGRAIGTIERNASSLTQIVEDILDVSRIISGKMRLDVQTVDLPDVVRSAVESVTPAAEAKGIRLETVLDPRASPISGDPARIQQVIWNLLANAVKFTGRGGKVQVRLQRVDSHVEVDVSDTGIGIAPDFLPFVFDRFRQADSSTARERGGLGLGLGIARQLVEMHGGTIEAASPGTDRGSTFRIKLPLMIVHPERAAATATAIASDRDGLAMPTPDLQNVHVLAVDDDRDALVLVRDILEAAGARVSTANSAFDALAALDGDRPDVLVADLGLPRMDGFQLIAEVRRHADDAVRSVPAAALTAYARSEDRARALRSGFHLHLAKPIDPTELMAAVASLARRKR